MDTKCSECGEIFESSSVSVKYTKEYEGIDVFVFNCPLCKKETDSLRCD